MARGSPDSRHGHPEREVVDHRRDRPPEGGGGSEEARGRSRETRRRGGKEGRRGRCEANRCRGEEAIRRRDEVRHRPGAVLQARREEPSVDPLRAREGCRAEGAVDDAGVRRPGEAEPVAQERRPPRAPGEGRREDGRRHEADDRVLPVARAPAEDRAARPADAPAPRGRRRRRDPRGSPVAGEGRRRRREGRGAQQVRRQGAQGREGLHQRPQEQHDDRQRLQGRARRGPAEADEAGRGAEEGETHRLPQRRAGEGHFHARDPPQGARRAVQARRGADRGRLPGGDEVEGRRRLHHGHTGQRRAGREGGVRRDHLGHHGAAERRLARAAARQRGAGIGHERRALALGRVGR